MIEQPIPYISLTDTVNEFMLGSFNDRRKYFVHYLNHAKWIWKKLLWNTIFAVQHKIVEVDTTTTPHSILLPKDMVRFINLSQEDDCRTMRSLAFKDNMVVISKTSTDCCPVCGSDSYLNKCVSNLSVIQKDVIIDDVVYIEKLWKKVCANGDMVEIRQFPTKDFHSGDPNDFDIIFLTQETFICKLDKKPCGCIEPSEKNVSLIVTHCGCFSNACTKDLCNPIFSKPYARFGVIKIENGRIYIEGNTSKHLILSYQTNGECGGEELMIPEFAVDTVIFGIDYRSKALAPNVDRFEKRESKREWNSSRQELAEFLDPIIVSEFMNAQMAIPLWGNASNYNNHQLPIQLSGDDTDFL